MNETRLAHLHEAQARRRFDAWSDSKTFQRLGPWLRYVQRNVLDRIEWHQVTAFLDVACGSGWAAAQAGRLLEGTSRGIACGCDNSVGMLARSAGDQSGGTKPFLAGASAQALPYRGDTFEAVICTAAFHHFPAPVEALEELKRVLRSGGKLIITDPCRDQSLGTWIWDRLHRWFEPGHVAYYRSSEVRAFLDAAGFTQVHVIELHPPFWKTRKLFSRVALFLATAP